MSHQQQTDTPKFTRNIEDFVCGHCGYTVHGNGYTNHCPQCLWSKHVDVHPGDRAATCNGMMEPIGLELKRGDKIIVHRCQTCRMVKRNKAALNDNTDILLELEPGY